MLKGFDEQGNVRNVNVTEEGELLVKVSGSGKSESDSNSINGTTLYAGVSTIGLNEITIGVNEKVSELSIANYSETANVSVSVDEKNYVIAPGLALDLPINKIVSIVGLSATEEDTKVQYVIKGFISEVNREIEITSNGSYNVSDYSTANVNVAAANYNVLMEHDLNKDTFSVVSAIKDIQLENIDTSNCQYMYEAFSNMSSLTHLDLSNINTDNCVTMYSMFYNCISLTSLDLTSFDTSNVENMSNMFYCCENLTELNLSSFNTSNVTDMSNMFNSCRSLTSLDLTSFDTSNVENMSNMFFSCENLTELNLSSFNTSNVTDMSNMFYFCRNLTELNIANFDISNVENFDYMFGEFPADCKIITNAATAEWLNTNFPELSNIEIV